jgi:hypothetical protein
VSDRVQHADGPATGAGVVHLVVAENRQLREGLPLPWLARITSLLAQRRRLSRAPGSLARSWLTVPRPAFDRGLPSLGHHSSFGVVPPRYRRLAERQPVYSPAPPGQVRHASQ